MKILGYIKCQYECYSLVQIMSLSVIVYVLECNLFYTD